MVQGHDRDRPPVGVTGAKSDDEQRAARPDEAGRGEANSASRDQCLDLLSDGRERCDGPRLNVVPRVVPFVDR